MYTTQSLYSAATGRTIETACRRLKSASIRAMSSVGPYGEHHYSLAGAVKTLRPREIASGAVDRLVASGLPSDNTLYVGGADANDIANRLIAWLPSGVMRDRVSSVQRAFISGVGNSRLCSPAIVENLGTLQVLVVLQPDVFRHVLTGTPRPDMSRMGPAFALVNNSADMIMEAA